jgi:hypothetical protein
VVLTLIVELEELAQEEGHSVLYELDWIYLVAGLCLPVILLHLSGTNQT